MTFVVALMERAGELDVEAAAIASLLGVSAYDVRSRITGALPRVLFQSPGEEEATRVRKALEARGHAAYQCDSRDIVPTERMVKLHRFSFDEAALHAHDGASDRLAWDDVGAVVVAAIRTTVSRVTRERQFETSESRPPYVEPETTTTEHVLTHAAYLFPRAAAALQRPWILEELTAQYGALGARMCTTRRQNFFAAIDLLRERATRAVFDDRFVAHRQTVPSILHVRGNDAPLALNSDAAVDLTLQILARWIMRDRSGPYRG